MTKLIQRYKDWQKLRAKNRGHKAFVNGFQWAMAEYYIERTSLTTLQMIVEGGGVGRGQFESGAEFAFDIISDFGK